MFEFKLILFRGHLQLAAVSLEFNFCFVIKVFFPSNQLKHFLRKLNPSQEFYISLIIILKHNL